MDRNIRDAYRKARHGASSGERVRITGGEHCGRTGRLEGMYARSGGIMILIKLDPLNRPRPTPTADTVLVESRYVVPI